MVSEGYINVLVCIDGYGFDSHLGLRSVIET